MKQNHNNKVSDESILECYNSRKTLHETAVELSMTIVSLWRRAKRLNIKWSDIRRTSNKKIDIMEILDGKYPEYQTFKLKKRLISEGIKENKCDVCNIKEWNNKPLIM